MENTEEFIVIPVEKLASSVAIDVGDDQKRLRNLINRRHPEYKEHIEHWDFLEDTYEGGREWFEENIFEYLKEGPKEFKERKKRAYRFNHTREVVDLLNKYLFRQPITRNVEDAPQVIKDFWKRSTRNGLGISDFSRQISKQSSIYGRIGIVIDTNAPSEALTVAEAKKAKVGIYAYIVSPKQLLDYSFDDQGDLNWVLIEESYRDDEDPMAEAEDAKCRWRLWTKTDWTLFEERKVAASNAKRIVIAKSMIHNLGQVPVILHDNILSDEEWTSQALIDDIAYLDRAVANYLSNLDAIIQDQTFSQLAMPAQGMMAGDKDYDKMIEVGTKRIFLYDAEGGLAPSFISPDVKQAQLIVGAISKIINEIYHTVGLAGERTKEDNSVGIDNSSGVAKAYDFERVNSLLAAKADSLESTENKINDVVCLWANEKLDEPIVSYPDNFDTRGLYDEFDIAARLILVEAPDEIRREQMKTVVSKLFPMASAELKAKIEAELNEWPLDPIEQAAAMMEATTPPESAITNTPKAKADGGKKPAKNNRQGQVTKATK